MPKHHPITFEEWEAEKMRDPEFRAACEALEAEYQAASLRILEGLHKCDPLELDKRPGIGYTGRYSTVGRVASAESTDKKP